MSATKHLEGQQFGRLVVISRLSSRNGKGNWLCECSCGNTVEVISYALTSGHTKSCGCWRDERNRGTTPKHGHARRGTKLTPTYRSWQAMMTRCYNHNAKSYKDYGGRGIRVCDGWHYFENFLAYMGERPDGKTLDRKDTNGDYTPDNCRWATRVEQARNTRSNNIVEFRGVRMTQPEFAELIGIRRETVGWRLRNGWTPEQVANTPPYTGNRVSTKISNSASSQEDLCTTDSG
jgi:hypothetical protein